jgi:hypothetical protein
MSIFVKIASNHSTCPPVSQGYDEEEMCLLFYIVSYVTEPCPAYPIGILLTNPTTNILRTRFLDNWAELSIDAEDVEVLSVLAADIEQKATRMGAHDVISQLLDSLSNAIRITDGEHVDSDNDDATLNHLFDTLVVQQPSRGE